MPLLAISEGQIRQNASTTSFSAGLASYEQGAVRSLVTRGNVLTIEVEIPTATPFQVRCTFDAAGLTRVACGCSDSTPPGYWCEHIVAGLLACARRPERVVERPALAAVLADLDPEQLRTLLLTLVAEDPDLAAAIERWLPAAGGVSTAPPRRIAPDFSSVRRGIRSHLRERFQYESWDDDSGVLEEDDSFDQARLLIAEGDAPTALALLGVITDEYLKGLEDVEDDHETLFDSLGWLWAEALLATEITEQDRRAWVTRLTAWRGKLAEFGGGSSLDVAIAAAEQGWEYPPLVRVLRGEITDQGAWDGDRPDCADELSGVRLQILERQGRMQEYLYLAEAEGQALLYVLMLVRLGRAADAVDYWRDCQGIQPSDTLTLATALREAGDLERALLVAELGLALPPSEPGIMEYAEPMAHGSKGRLAAWLRDLARGMGRTEQALAAALVAFEEHATLANYLQISELAGETWPRHRLRLLDRLRQTPTYMVNDRVDIYLHEGLLEDAMSLADQQQYSYTLVRQVVDAVLTTHPDWAIRASRAQAEPIMNGAKSKYYHHAANWLATARMAYLAAGHEAEWQAYREELLVQHKRKHSLIPLIKGLG